MANKEEGAQLFGNGKIALQRSGGVLVIELNNPDNLNATSPEMLNDLTAVLDSVIDRSIDARAVVITGKGRGFCSGANLAVHAKRILAEDNFDPGLTLDQLSHPLLRRLRGLPVPWISAVNGPAVGFGMSLALHGDIVLMADSAFFMAAFSRIGLVPDGGSSWLLPRLIGLAKAKELMLLGGKVDAGEALAMGLIAHVHPADTLLDEAVKLAERLARGPTRASALTRELFWKSYENSFEEQIALERRNLGLASKSSDFREGISAFWEKRPAEFTGL